MNQINGYIIYKQADLLLNNSYITWLQEEGLKRNLVINVLPYENFIAEGSNIDNIKFVINRTREYSVALQFELSKIRVFNNSFISLLGNDKLFAHKFAMDKGFPVANNLVNFMAEKNYIRKPNFSHGGKSISLIKETNTPQSNSFINQSFLDIQGDIRFYIINNKITHSVIRYSNNLTSNYSQGGNFKVYDYTKSEESTVLKFINNLNIDYCGVDFFLTHNKTLIFNEFEDMVGSRMLSSLNINNTTPLFLDHIFNSLNTHM